MVLTIHTALALTSDSGRGYVLQDVGMLIHSDLGFVWGPEIPNKTKGRHSGSLHPNVYLISEALREP